MKILPSARALWWTIMVILVSTIVIPILLSLSAAAWLKIFFVSLAIFVILCIARVVDFFFDHYGKNSKRLTRSEDLEGPIDFNGY